MHQENSDALILEHSESRNGTEEAPLSEAPSLESAENSPSLEDGLSRREGRSKSADILNSLSADDLYKFQITRVSQITWFDTIGIPVWKTTRPAADVLSVNSGKGLDPLLARAGAIAEGIEFWAMEHPDGPFVWDSYQGLKSKGVLIPDIDSFPTCANSLFNGNSFCAWEAMENLFDDKSYMIPSDCIWMSPRIKQDILFFQSGSNGGAFAQYQNDALCSALYELVERDAWCLYEVLVHFAGKYPPKVSLEHCEGPIQDAVDRINVSGSRIFLFDVTTNIDIRVFGAYLFDLNYPEIGVFGGFGCSIDPHEAALRAITEACQSRACYLDGARDDLARRSFYILKSSDHGALMKILEDLPYGARMEDYILFDMGSSAQEIGWIKQKLSARGLTQLFWKTIWKGELGGNEFQVVKAVSFDLEQIRCSIWRPGPRSVERLEEEVAECKK